MATKFALPVGHLVPTPVTRGRPFRQPLASSTNTTVPGLEMLLNDSGEEASIYASLDGNLAWEPGTGGAPNRLILEVDEFTATPSLRQVKVWEAAPLSLIYENVDKAKIQTYLEVVLNNAYQDAQLRPDKPKTWHPAMREASAGVKFKQLIDEQGVGEIHKKVDAFLNGGARYLRVAVLAGERVGAAAPKPPGSPAGPTHALIFHMVDTGAQHINPLYYLHLYTRAPVMGAQVTVITNLTGHPFMSTFTELAPNTPRPAPREPVASEDQFPLGVLKTLQRVPSSQVTWAYPNEKLAVDGSALAPSSADVGFVNTTWQTIGADLAEMCKILQVPCEVPTGIFAAESSGNPRVYRLEPLQRKVIEAANRPDLVALYEEVLGIKIVSYTPTRLPAAEEFGKDVVTSLDATLDEARSIGRDSLKGKNPSVISVERSYRPVVVSNQQGASTTQHRIDIAEERLARDISFADSATPFFHPAPEKVDPQRADPSLRQAASSPTAFTYVSDRGGRVRVLRAQVKATVPFDVIVTLFVNGSPTINATIPADAPNGFTVDGTTDVNKNDVIAIEIQATGPVELGVEWFLGVGASTPIFLTGTGGRSINQGLNPVPVPWVTGDSAKVRTGRDMSWDQLLDLIDVTGGPLISPGISQTLIMTAAGTLNQLKAVDPGLLAHLNITPPVEDSTSVNKNKTLKDMLRGTTAAQEAAGAAPRVGWLLIPRNAALVGLAKIRFDYNRTPGKFDLPRTVNLYFQGGRNVTLTKDMTRWGMTLPTPEWIDIVGRRYNAALDKFNGGATPAPTVRFKL